MSCSYSILAIFITNVYSLNIDQCFCSISFTYEVAYEHTVLLWQSWLFSCHQLFMCIKCIICIKYIN